MSPERWAQVEELFHRVKECGPNERSGMLEETGRADPELRREVELLLESYQGASAHLREVVGGQAASMVEGSAVTRTDCIIEAAEPGRSTVLGPYHLLQLIGEGGMGEVWLAEQREPVRRRVAVKLVKAGLNNREVIARVESERQALALMDHPAIAKVFDAGSTPQGTPYFVMEYVAGVPITTYCDSHRFNNLERLELFRHVCEGVQHAHQKAIIHRDLKPSNILVTEVDGHAAPKIIDFGVAKALAQKLTDYTMLTRVGALIGTPEYMSPEQALSSGEDIDTRTDVYSLGIILYELLAGAPPLELRKITLEELLRRLREAEPPKPSTRIRTQDPATFAQLAHKRQTEPMALAKQLCGDLDSIVLKALEKERARRYGSPSDLAADIGRYLNHELVHAVPPSVAYRARKFARRYRAALITAAAFVVVLIAAAAISIRQSIRANREAAVAQREAATAQAINDFLQNDLLAQASANTQAGPKAKPDPHLEVRTALDRAAARIGGKFAKQPAVEAAIRDTIGQTYVELGLYPEARTQLEPALELHRRSDGPENPKTLKAIGRLGRIAYLQGKYPEAEALFSQALAIQRRVLGSGDTDTLSSMSGLANTYYFQGKYPKAEALHTEILQIRRRVLGPEHRDTLASMHNLGVAYEEQGKYAQAEAIDSQAVDAERRVLGPDHPSTLATMNNLALVYYAEGKFEQAEALYGQILEIKRRVLGPEHPDTLASMHNLTLVYKSQGKFAGAESLSAQIVEIQRRVLGPEHPLTLTSIDTLARLYLAKGNYGQAEALHSQILEIRRRALGPEHSETLANASALAAVYTAEGKYAQAELLYTHTLEIQRRVLGPEHPSTLVTLSNFAFLYQAEGKYALAEAQAEQALAGRRHALGAEHPDTMVSAADLALAFVSEGKFAAAEASAREALEFYRGKQPDDWPRFRSESLLGESLAGQKKYADAEPLLVEGYQGMLARRKQIAVPDRYNLERGHKWVVQLYEAWGKPEKAQVWRKK